MVFDSSHYFEVCPLNQYKSYRIQQPSACFVVLNDGFSHLLWVESGIPPQIIFCLITWKTAFIYPYSFGFPIGGILCTISILFEDYLNCRALSLDSMLIFSRNIYLCSSLQRSTRQHRCHRRNGSAIILFGLGSYEESRPYGRNIGELNLWPFYFIRFSCSQHYHRNFEGLLWSSSTVSLKFKEIRRGKLFNSSIKKWCCYFLEVNCWSLSTLWDETGFTHAPKTHQHKLYRYCSILAL